MTTNRSNGSPAILEEWRTSRSGAWAARGFDYQHLVSTLIIVRQWASVAPAGNLVPEGLDDCVVELPEGDVWIQAKSRHDGTFGKAEIDRFRRAAAAKAAAASASRNIRPAIVLERPFSGIPSAPIDSIFDDKAGDVFVCGSPDDEILALLSRELNIAPITADGIVNDLYRLIAESSAINASRAFDERRRISPTEVEKRIRDRLDAEDPSSIHTALSSGHVVPVEFVTRVQEPAFYQGVRVRPGHVAAGLVLGRHADTTKVSTALQHRRHVLLTGPSGAGKSALIWLAARALPGFRWFEIGRTATATDASSIMRFIRSRRPAKTSPIALAFDDIGSVGSDLWNVLARELRGLPGVYLLGSIRQEDLALISNQADVDIISIRLDEALAQSVWEKLAAKQETKWVYWREPFEQSDGLLLEYVHLLTQGRRLAAVIGEQVRQRELEDRNDELAIIRSIAALCVHGGEVNAHRLLQLLNLERHAGTRALRRLLDEHLVLEQRPGILGGLHPLRSQALLDASHDEAINLRAKTLWQSLSATTHGSLPSVIQSVLVTSSAEEEQDTLDRLADILQRHHEVDIWAAILTGLGLATLERYVSSIKAMLEAHHVPRSAWSIAAMFASTEIDLPDLSQSEQWQTFRDVIGTFRTSAKYDLRSACLDQLPSGYGLPLCTAVGQANRLLSCLVPICGTQPEPIPFELRHTDDPTDVDVRQIASLLSTAYLVSPASAEHIVDELGGQQALLDLFDSQTPWTTAPTFESGPHGHTIRADWFHLGEEHQSDPHDTVCQICETLIALCPDADAAASTALDPAGTPVTIGDLQPWSKNMPRANIPAKSLVAWNVAFRQVFQAGVADSTLTDYVRNIAPLVRETESLFRSCTEKWVQGKPMPDFDTFSTRIGETIEATNALAYASTAHPSDVMTEPAKERGSDDTLGGFLTGVLGNLLLRLHKVQKGKAAATYAGSLAEQAREHRRSDIWRMSPNPPLTELSTLAIRLTDVSRILHERSETPDDLAATTRASRKGSRNRAVSVAARHCTAWGKRRLASRLQRLTTRLKQSGVTIRCHQRPIREANAVYWPPRAIAVLVDVPDVEPESLLATEDALTAAQDDIGEDWPLVVAPVMQGVVLADLALRPSSTCPQPDFDFMHDWSEHLELPIHTISSSTRPLDEGISACHRVSATLACREVKDMHVEEENALVDAVDCFERSQRAITETADRVGTEDWLHALEYLEATWHRVANEYEARLAGQPVPDPLCMTLHESLSGQANEHIDELAAIRLALFQSGSRVVVPDQEVDSDGAREGESAG